VKLNSQSRPCAFVIGSNDTAISTAWCLADAGVPVRIVCLDPPGIGRYSRRVKVTDLTELGADHTAICEKIAAIAKAEPVKPVIIPCGDPDSLMIARHRGLLEPYCCMSSLTLEELLAIVSKDGLYAAAMTAGIETPPTLIAPTVAELTDWTSRHPAPYLAKPYYLGLESSVLKEKNRIFDTADELLGLVTDRGASSLIVQQLIRGGDGWVFDCYGVCDRRGRIITMASHRRLRQHPAHRGVSSFGEIPSRSVPDSEAAIFGLTEKLLSHVRYHGIFGIEWVRDLKTKRFYLLDFNARPFLTIRHLKDCGLNLAVIAYEEFAGRDLTAIEKTPRLKHKYWLDLPADIRSFKQHRDKKEIGFGGWLASLTRPTSFAVLSVRDPLPTMIRSWQTITSFARFAVRRLT